MNITTLLNIHNDSGSIFHAVFNDVSRSSLSIRRYNKYYSILLKAPFKLKLCTF